jgi:hypothetical protein
MQGLQSDSHAGDKVWQSCRGYSLTVMQGLQSDSHAGVTVWQSCRDYSLTILQGFQADSHTGTTVSDSYGRIQVWQSPRNERVSVWQSCKDSSLPVMQWLHRHATALLSLSGTKLVIMFDKQSTANIFISAYQRDKHYLWIILDGSLLTSLFRRAQKMVDPQPIVNYLCCDWFDIC